MLRVMTVLFAATSLVPAQAVQAQQMIAYGVIEYADEVGDSAESLAFVTHDCPDDLAFGARRDAYQNVVLNLERLWGRALRLRALEPDTKTLNPTGRYAVPVLGATVERQCDFSGLGTFTTNTQLRREVTFVVHGSWMKIGFGAEFHYKQPYELYLVE